MHKDFMCPADRKESLVFCPRSVTFITKTCQIQGYMKFRGRKKENCFSLLGGLSTFSMSTMSLSSISSHASSEWMKADGKDMIDSNGKSFKSHVGYIHSYVPLSYVSLSKFMLVFHLFLLKLF